MRTQRYSRACTPIVIEITNGQADYVKFNNCKDK